MRRLLAFALAGLVAAGCGTAAAQHKTATSPPPNALDIVVKLQGAGLPLQQPILWGAANDPNSLIGRPHGDLSSATWVDPRSGDTDITDGTSAGGTVEVWPSAAAATARAVYIQGFGKASPLFIEYDYLAGQVLLRLSGKLTPAQASAYATVIGAKLYTPTS